MYIPRLLLVGSIVASIGLGNTFAAESNALPKNLLRFSSGGVKLGLYDGVLYFSCAPGVPATTKEPSLSTRSYYFQRLDDNLSLLIAPNERGQNKAHDAQNWKYLTADYSTDPPSVTLTKSPGKYSKWAIEYIKIRPSGEEAYVRNINDLDKDAWLYWEQDGPIVSHGLSRCKLLKPILSFEKKVIYDSPKVRPPDSK